MSAKLAAGFIAILAVGVVLDPDDIAHAEVDHGRACLALAAFSEARSDGDLAMSTVMRVVLNRATDPAHRWPRTVCGVVMQPGQFLGVEAWNYPRVPNRYDLPAWSMAMRLADEAVAGTEPTPDQCRSATSFHQAPIIRGLVPVCRVGAHTFFIEPRVSVAGLSTSPEQQRSP